MHLALDTSTSRPLVAILEKDLVLYDWQGPSGTYHGEYLLSGIEEGLDKINIKLSDLEFISVGIGPGTFTGLRVGVIIAKFLADTNCLPLVPISSLQALLLNSHKIGGSTEKKFHFWALQDAKRHEVYAISNSEDAPFAISPEKLADQLNESSILIGEGAENYKKFWPSSSKLAPSEHLYLRAENIGKIAWKMFGSLNLNQEQFPPSAVQAFYLRTEKF